MNTLASTLRDAATYLGAQDAGSVRDHERDRAAQRAVVCLILITVWVLDGLRAGFDHGPVRVGVCAAAAYLLLTLAYRHSLRTRPKTNLFALYAFLVADPLVIVFVLVLDPYSFAFLHPLLLVVVIRTGIRYGIRTMYLSWTAAITGSALLLTSPFWRSETQLSLALLLMLCCTPLFFSALVRRVHNVRAIEEDRARLTAMHEAVVTRSSFLAKVSHELRSPLQGIVSALDVLALRHGPGTDADDEIINRIRRSSVLLNTQLRDLLTLAKGESGHLELHPEPFDAAALIEGVAASARELALSKGLELVTEVPPSATYVVADGARIDQILTNLVINSIRYTETGVVRLSLQAYDRNERVLRFVVSDTGPGIPAAVVPLLLTPDLVPSGTERRGGGSGIGLAIVRTLVQHLGGTVDVSSTVGTGTTFQLAIPAEQADFESTDSMPESRTGRVLIVDDREDVLDALASVVDELGFECDRTTSAAVSANLLASRAYDAVLLDIDMPIKGGGEIAAETRRGNGPNCAGRFIGISAGDRPEASAGLFDVCLSKPIDRAALRRILLGSGPSARPSQPGLWSDNV